MHPPLGLGLVGRNVYADVDVEGSLEWICHAQRQLLEVEMWGGGDVEVEKGGGNGKVCEVGDIFLWGRAGWRFVVLWCALCIVYCGGEELRGFGGSFGRFMLL